MVKRKALQDNILNSWLKQLFVQLVVERTGIKVRENDQEVFERIIATRLQSLGLSFPEEYYQLLEAQTQASEAEWKSFIAEITNSESFFFRDKGQIKLLKDYLLPELIRARRGEKTLRICSAGCSTGEEPYSIAMLLQDLIPDFQTWEITILGVDLNAAAVEKARTGLYRPWSFRGVDPALKQRFFTEKGGLCCIAQSIKDMVYFQTGNLLQDDFRSLEFSLESMDLIVCRNVFIYFSDAAIEQVLDKFYHALNPDGYLLVGHAELHSQKLTQFRVKVFEESIAYQRSPGATSVRPRPQHVPSTRRLSASEAAPKDLRSLNQQLEGNTTKMQQSALGLLRQLPADMRIPRLGNLTASELIAQIEQNLNATK
ncbi:MAG: CheR family methyltransferase [Elainellaceae cyanobacterium]